MALTIQMKARLLQLANDLSPENLHCDGEISHADAMRRKRAIMKEWAQIEHVAGRKISETQACQWADEVSEFHRMERAAMMAALPSHPLVESKNPGVWVRKGRDGRTAYYIWGPPHHGSDYKVFSEFAHMFGRNGMREQISANHQSLAAAVAAGEEFLGTVNADFILAKYPQYRPENLKRELERLPEGFDGKIPPMPPVTGFTVRQGDNVLAEGIAADEVAVWLTSRLTERGQALVVEAVG